MSAHIFDIFSKMISNLPQDAIINALDRECQMLADDMENRRLDSPEAAFSITCFRQFVHAAKDGKTMQHVKSLPLDHIEFYKETVVRLIQAGELPQSAMSQFDSTFLPGIIFRKKSVRKKIRIKGFLTTFSGIK